MSLDAIVRARDEWLAVLARDDDSVLADATSRLDACREALTIVQGRLEAIGYPVHPIVRPLDPAGLADVRRAFGTADVAIPPLLALAWEVVGAVSVLDFDRYRHVAFWRGRLEGTDWYTDGLHIDAPDDLSYVDYVAGERENWLESGLADEGAPFELPIAPDDFHKDDVSGGDPYGLRVGTGAFDHRVVQMRWRGNPATAPPGAPDLISYLRTAVLEGGCFPGLLGTPAYEGDRQYLTADLPIF